MGQCHMRRLMSFFVVCIWQNGISHDKAHFIFRFRFSFFRMLTHTYVLGVYIGVIVFLAGKTCFIT